jgi:hypothetical protein
VGAPLNSAPATTKTAAVTQQPVSVSTPQISLPQTQATTVAPGMNLHTDNQDIVVIFQ